MTDACNLACRSCFNEWYPSRGRTFMSANLLEECLRGLERDIRSVKITGGEPLLHPAIREVASVAVLFGPASLTTNGLLLKERFWELPENLSVTVSVYGTSSDEFVSYTQMDARAFARFRSGLEVVAGQCNRFAANVLVRGDAGWNPQRYLEFCQAAGFPKVRFISLLGPEASTPSYKRNAATVARLFARASVVDPWDPSVLVASWGSIHIESVKQYNEFDPAVGRLHGFLWIGPKGEVYESENWDVFDGCGWRGAQSEADGR